MIWRSVHDTRPLAVCCKCGSLSGKTTKKERLLCKVAQIASLAKVFVERFHPSSSKSKTKYERRQEGKKGKLVHFLVREGEKGSLARSTVVITIFGSEKLCKRRSERERRKKCSQFSFYHERSKKRGNGRKALKIIKAN